MNTSQPDKDLSYIHWKAWNPSEFGTFSRKDNAVFACELRKARIKLDSTSYVLEIGFGNGAFAGWVLQRTPCYVGVESNPELISRARHAGIEAHGSTVDLSALARGRSFGLIAIFDVLEHLEVDEILEILHSARDCLSPDGRIVIRVPSGDSPFSGHLMHGDITHRTFLGRYAFYQLAKLAGLEVASVHDAAFPILGAGTFAAFKRIAVLLARKVCSTVIRAIYYANEPAILGPNLVAVLRKPSAEVNSGER